MITLHKKMAVESHEILDGLVESAKNEDCPHRFANGRWLIDKLMPNVSYVREDSHHTVDVEVVAQLSEGAKTIEAFVETRGSGFEIEEDDIHLHDGKEFMAERERGLVNLGSEE
jgi:hypothetical protein